MYDERGIMVEKTEKESTSAATASNHQNSSRNQCVAMQHALQMNASNDRALIRGSKILDRPGTT